LVVDDSSVFLHTLCSWLDADPNVGHVTTAMNGLEALAMVDDSCPDLVLLDIQMPGMSGLQAVAKLLRRYPLLPVVMMTAHDIPGLREECKHRGAHAFVAKRQLLQELPDILAKVHLSL